MLIDAFLARVDDFLARSGRQEGGLADVLFGDGKRIKRLRSGKSCTVASLERAHARLDELVAKLDAEAAMRSAVGGGEEAVHPENLTPGGSDCDRNGAGQLRGEGVS